MVHCVLFFIWRTSSNKRGKEMFVAETVRAFGGGALPSSVSDGGK